jgi:hypothetical protein
MRERHLASYLHFQPFRPFFLYLLDGTSFEVRHPELVLVDEGLLHLSIPADPARSIMERDVVISIDAISRLEFEQPTKRTL